MVNVKSIATALAVLSSTGSMLTACGGSPVTATEVPAAHGSGPSAGCAASGNCGAKGNCGAHKGDPAAPAGSSKPGPAAASCGSAAPPAAAPAVNVAATPAPAPAAISATTVATPAPAPATPAAVKPAVRKAPKVAGAQGGCGQGTCG